MADHRHGEQLAAYDTLTRNPRFPYRACAPDPDNPTVTAINPGVPIGVWLACDGESQITRPAREQQAIALCQACPILAECRTYALAHETGRNHQDVWGGQTPQQRVDEARRHQAGQQDTAAGPVDGPSQLDLRVLRALAAHRAPAAVARAAGLTLARTNWHRSKLVTYYRLDPATATRGQLLHAARRAGHLDPTVVLVSDRGLTAAIPSRQTSVEHAHHTTLPGLETTTAVRQLTRPPRATAPAGPGTAPGPAAGDSVLAAAA